MISAIEEFLKAYDREFDFYTTAASKCQKICEDALREHGIRAIVSSRAKDPQKLLEKIGAKSLEGKQYSSVEAVRRDIHDLAGVRIALYFPGDEPSVRKLIVEIFSPANPPIIKTGREHSSEVQRFRGYCATHFRVNLPQKLLGKAGQKYRQAEIEIQVASVLMHAWAEVEHDLDYKRESGNLSDAEVKILDQVNGLVISGEIALGLLQEAQDTRIAAMRNRPFEDHFDLAAYLANWARRHKITNEVGRVQDLWKLLKLNGDVKADNVDPFLKERLFIDDSKTISQGICDELLSISPWLLTDYVTSRAPAYFVFEEGASNALEQFVEHYLGLSLAVKEWSHESTEPSEEQVDAFLAAANLSQRARSELGLLKDTRDKVLDSTWDFHVLMERIRAMPNYMPRSFAELECCEVEEIRSAMEASDKKRKALTPKSKY